MKGLYLLINLASLSVPLIFSFHPRFPFFRLWRSWLPALTITAGLFLLWDAYFVHWNVWGFNDRYILGLRIGNLPLEEILFFYAIPFACLFTYFCVRGGAGDCARRFPSQQGTLFLGVAAGIALLSIAALFHDRMYTASTAATCAALLLVQATILRSPYLPLFFFSFALLLVPFVIVNGILTGSGIDQEVVWYNNTETLGIRLGTIPIEDAFYALLLTLTNVTLFEHFRGRATPLNS